MDHESSNHQGEKAKMAMSERAIEESIAMSEANDDSDTSDDSLSDHLGFPLPIHPGSISRNQYIQSGPGRIPDDHIISFHARSDLTDKKISVSFNNEKICREIKRESETMISFPLSKIPLPLNVREMMSRDDISIETTIRQSLRIAINNYTLVFPFSFVFRPLKA